MKHSIKDILAATEHRPWAVPNTPWKFYQEWNDAVFLHWKVDLDLLKQFVPKDIEIDLFEGQAWVSLVAFKMEKMRPRNLPSVGDISNFDEINIRTYIKTNGKAGVHFLSIEAGSKISCLLAKNIAKLPYRYSKMQRRSKSMNSMNLENNESFNINYTTQASVSSKTNLEIWLTERYALCQDHKNEINEYEIHHLEWPLNTIEIENVAINYPRFEGLIGRTPDMVHYSNGVQVVAWAKKVIRTI